jgi:hypothetical protein
MFVDFALWSEIWIYYYIVQSLILWIGYVMMLLCIIADV